MSSYYVLKIQYVNRPPETRNISAPTTTVGRETGDIVLNDPQTSGRHAEIVFQGGQVRVRDAGSTNGTWFNGQRLTEFAMEAGQWFQVGQTTLQLMAVHGAAAPGPSAGPAKTMMAMGAPPPAAGPAAAPGSAPVGWAPPGGAAAPAPAPAPAPVAAQAPGYPPAGGGYPPASGGGYPPAGGGGYPPAGGGGYPPAGGGYPQAQPQAPAPMSPPPGPPNMGPGPAPMGHGPGMGPGPAPGMGPGPGPAPGQLGQGGMGGMGGMGPQPVMGSQPGMGMGAMAPMGAGGPPMGAPPGMAPMGMGGGGVRPNFQGSGGELLVTCLVGALLSIITIYIYLPWFVCKLARYVANNTTLGPTRRGELRLEFTGTGGELFVTGLVGVLLTSITFGIYMPWFMCKMLKFFTDNTQAVAPDGTRYRLAFEGTGGELFVTYLVGAILTTITLYIYVPWFVCKLTKWAFSNIRILENEQPVGSLDFEGTGGELFVTYLVGMLLTIVTLYIYLPWFQVKMTRFIAEGTRITYQGRTFQGQFHGTGGELFVILLLHGLLTVITLYIYLPWFMVKQWEFNINNREFTEIAGAGAGMGGPAFQPHMPMQMR